MDRRETAQLLEIAFDVAMKLDSEFYEKQMETGQSFNVTVEVWDGKIQMKFAGIIIWNTEEHDSRTFGTIEADARKEIADLVETVKKLKEARVNLVETAKKLEGPDTVIQTRVSPLAQMVILMSYLRNKHPQGVTAPIGPCEIMFYTSQAERDSWDADGRTEKNAGEMIHVICKEGEVTLAHESDLDVDEIRKNLEANSHF